MFSWFLLKLIRLILISIILGLGLLIKVTFILSIEIRRMDLKNINEIVLACSVKTKFGIGHLRCRLLQAIEQSKPRNIDNN